MARDYGTKRTTRKKGGLSQQLLIIIVSFLLGYVCAVFVDIQTVSTWVNNQISAHDGKQKESPKLEPQQAQIPPKPKFEFYTLLANEKGATQPSANSHSNASTASSSTTSRATPTVNGTAAIASAAQNSVKPRVPVTNQSAAVKVAEGKPLPPTQPNKGSYLVQVAAFKTRNDAEHMKGMLILKGFDVNVVPITTSRGNWFRVVVGPYSNRMLAQNAQLALAKTERLNGMVTATGG